MRNLSKRTGQGPLAIFGVLVVAGCAGEPVNPLDGGTAGTPDASLALADAGIQVREDSGLVDGRIADAGSVMDSGPVDSGESPASDAGAQLMTVERMVGQAGATIDTPTMTMVIPAGALDEVTMIRISEATTGSYYFEQDVVRHGRVLHFEPDGLAFLNDVRVDFNNGSDRDVIYWSDPGSPVMNPIETRLGPDSRTLTATITHFSRGGIAELPVGAGATCPVTSITCTKSSPPDPALDWLPGYVMPAHTERSASASQAGDSSRIVEIQQAVSLRGRDETEPPVCLVDAVEPNIEYDPPTHRSAERNPNETHWLSAQTAAATRALAAAVEDEFGLNYQLRVTSGLHSAVQGRSVNSLHRFGAAVDLTLCELTATSCVKRPRLYGRLAAVAWGIPSPNERFDWIWYENHAHLHASTVSPSTRYALTEPSATYCQPPCEVMMAEGTCQSADSCVGTSSSGQCPGPPSYQCCISAVPPVGYVVIPAGIFTMGSPSGELGRGSNETQHQVTITRSFYMKATEVTQVEWVAVMGSNPSYFVACGANCPVERVTWFDGVAYMNALSAAEGLPACYDASGAFAGLDCTGYRYPTEAEWEYAARAGTATAFHTGPITSLGTDPDPALNRGGWYFYNSGQLTQNGTTYPVALKDINAFGLYDMHGNVWEWVHDWYAGYNSSSVVDPVGAQLGSFRVSRGGSWGSVIQYCRSAHRRSFIGPTRQYSDLGFRPVRSIP